MQKKKIKITQKQIELLAENEFAKMRDGESQPEGDVDTPADDTTDDHSTTSGIDKMIGDDPTDRRIEYPSPGDLEALSIDKEMDTESGDKGGAEFDPKDMKSPPHELLDYLDKIEEAKSILSKVAAKEDNDNIKNRIYSHYEKAQKLAFELIKEFGIVH